jgi:hypothetical protein
MLNLGHRPPEGAARLVGLRLRRLGPLGSELGIPRGERFGCLVDGAQEDVCTDLAPALLRRP